MQTVHETHILEVDASTSERSEIKQAVRTLCFTSVSIKEVSGWLPALVRATGRHPEPP
jgi:hypothetical protein